jgi:cystathionine beta-lyase
MSIQDDTLLVSAGRDPAANHGVVNPPIYRASTILFPTLAAFKNRKQQRYTGLTYGLHGTPTTFALAQAVAEVEGGARAVVVSSGQSAISMVLTAFVKAGDHILVTDSAYEPTRVYCDVVLARFGVETTYYDPRVGAGIAALIRPNTRLIFMESPGSLTFEVQDVPAIAAAARARGVLTALDNTWGTPLYCKPFRLGVDLSIQAGTKYIAGHSDLMLGIVTTATEELYRRVRDFVSQVGDCPSPEECYLALRGLRTLGVRLRRHEQSALKIARWLADRPEVARVLYPALPDDPGHALWKRDFGGACGLFGVLLRTGSEAAVAALVDGLRWFGIGASWGGYESLVIPGYPSGSRTAVPWTEPGFLLRMHVGLEDADDLIADLAAGFQRLAAAQA